MCFGNSDGCGWKGLEVEGGQQLVTQKSLSFCDTHILDQPQPAYLWRDPPRTN